MVYFMLDKEDRRESVLQLIRGDRDTTSVCFQIPRFDGECDLHELGWSVKICNANNDTDVSVIEMVPNGDMLECMWTIPAICAAAVGTTLIELEGVNAEDGTRVWQSGKRKIKVIDDLDAEPGYDPETLSEFEQALSNATVLIGQIDDQMNERLDLIDSKIMNDFNELIGDVNTDHITNTPESYEVGGIDKTSAVDAEIVFRTSSSYCRAFVPVSGGDTYRVTVKQTTATTNYVSYVFATDDSNVVKEIVERITISSTSSVTYDIVIPNGATRLWAMSNELSTQGTKVMKFIRVVIHDLQSQIDDIIGIATESAKRQLKIAANKVMEKNKDNICLNFPLITDTHSNGIVEDVYDTDGTTVIGQTVRKVHAEQNISLFADLANSGMADFAMHAGDIVSCGSRILNTQEEFFNGAIDAMSYMGRITCPLYIARGNHDINSKSSGGNFITAAQWYSLTQKRTVCCTVSNADSTRSGYFYKDFPIQKIRVIVLCNYYGATDGQEHVGVYGDELKWYAEHALDLSEYGANSGWVVLPIIHYYTDNMTSEFWKVTNHFMNGTSGNVGNAHCDYTVQGAGTVAAIIHGHKHDDRYTTVNGVNVIGNVRGYLSEEEYANGDYFRINFYTVDPIARKIYISSIGGNRSDREYSY